MPPTIAPQPGENILSTLRREATMMLVFLICFKKGSL